MADVQISQSGPLSRKIIHIDVNFAKCLYFAPQHCDSRFDDEAAISYSAQHAGVLVENLHHDHTRFFHDKLDWHLPKLGRMCYIPKKMVQKVTTWQLKKPEACTPLLGSLCFPRKLERVFWVFKDLGFKLWSRAALYIGHL